MKGITPGGRLALAERERQIEEEHYSEEHDDMHEDGALAHAGAAYAVHATGYVAGPLLQGDCPSKPLWPFEEKLKPSSTGDIRWGDEIRDMTKAAALMIAELDRLVRLRATAARELLAGVRTGFQVVKPEGCLIVRVRSNGVLVVEPEPFKVLRADGTCVGSGETEDEAWIDALEKITGGAV